MSKRILILEPSATMQSLFAEKAKKTDFEFSFDTNGIRFLVTLYNSLPNAVLINARNMNPSCPDIVRLIKSISRFKNIPVGIYATSDFLFDKDFTAQCGADMFLTFDPATIMDNLEVLYGKREQKLAMPTTNNIMKVGILQTLFSLIDDLESIDDIAGIFLNLLAELGELPACALVVNLEGEAEGFYITAENFTEKETTDFTSVSKSDFEDLFPGLNMDGFSMKQVEDTVGLEKFHTEDIPLSAYQMIQLSSTYGIAFATVHVVKEGAFTTRQLDLFSYAAEKLTLVLHSAIKTRAKLKFERNIRKAFSRFVPEQIIDELVDSAEREAKVGVGEKRDVAILFSDIRSFTNISERNKPETIVAFLNRYFTTMCTIIKKHGGTIDKFIGDAIMALFGAPVSYEDNAARAAAAAYEMREALPSVPLEDLVLPEGMKFDIGIGIHYGDVIVGSIGSDDKTDYSVIGDSVNLASRLEGLTKTYGTKVLVSQAVKDDCTNTDFIFRHLDDVKVKGKAKAVPIYAIDRSMEDFTEEYRDAYDKGFALYKQGVWNLAFEYFEKAHAEAPDDKAAKLMLSRCEEFIKNPPESWDGAIAFTTK
ncbi:MAG: adenylate/guanylate cyclase domain-containing protein [Treponema sp.]|nr:adenylate/guanylate cyclase domain-containing protein [Treponema sp.]